MVVDDQSPLLDLPTPSPPSDTLELFDAMMVDNRSRLSLVLVSTSLLPPADILKALNEIITRHVVGDLKAKLTSGKWRHAQPQEEGDWPWRPGGTGSTFFAALILKAIGQHCDAIENLTGDDWVCLADASNDLVEMCRKAWDKGDYSEIIRIDDFRRDAKTKTPSPMRIPAKKAAIMEAWIRPFVGNCHTLLAENIIEMNKINMSLTNTDDNHYLNYVSIVQSSGSGKSRMVDELAKEKFFTIPFNLRDEGESDFGPYPPPDSQIRDLFVKNGLQSIEDSQEPAVRRYHCILASIFSCVKEALEAPDLTSQPVDDQALANAWYLYLRDHRSDLYHKISNRAKTNINDLHLPPAESYSDFTTSQLKELIGVIDKRSPKGKGGEIKVFMYFDEAHVLAGDSDADYVQGKFNIDVLISVLNELRGSPLFVVILSTQSNLEYLAPSSAYAQSARYRLHVNYMHTPITETPFDCFWDKCIIGAQLDAETVSDVAYMSLFGRPLWRSYIKVKDVDEIVSQVTERGMKHVTLRSDSNQAPRYDGLITFARTKLLNSENIKLNSAAYTAAARTAALDIRIMLSFEPGRTAAHKREIEMISSHMRTVFSIPTNRETIRSGYPSEPILAEAAARQLHFWRTEEPGQDPEIAILRENTDHNLLSPGELGEAIGRLLLIRARDNAVVKKHQRNTNSSSKMPHFSSAVTAKEFLRELLADDVFDKFTSSKPDNDPDGATLSQLLEETVIGFTHFTKWADSSSSTVEACAAAFSRSAAIIGRNGCDLIVPSLLKGKPVIADNMVPILVQLKLCIVAGVCAVYAINADMLNLFPRKSTGRPYITLTMELGTQATGGKCKEGFYIPTNAETKRRSLRNKARASQRVNPRYSLYLYGCTPEVYRVIDERDRDKYSALLRKDHLLSNHPRQDLNSLVAIRMQKPFFAVGAAFHWWKSDFLNPQDMSSVKYVTEAKELEHFSSIDDDDDEAFELLSSTVCDQDTD